jgi:bile acid:Na+ symporter, BASS family
VTGFLYGYGSLTGGILTAVYLVAMMFSVGIGLRVGREPAGEKHGQLGIHLRALLFNLVLVPAVAVLLTRSMHLSDDVAVALLLLAATPGGRFAPHFTRIARGEVALASEHTALLGKITVFTAPLTAKALLGLHHLQLTEWPIIADAIVLQVVPLYAGKLIARHRAAFAERVERPLRIFVTLVALATLAAFLAVSGLRSVELLGDRGWLVVLVFAAALLGLGWRLGGLAAFRRRALVIIGLSRNLALALLLAGIGFPGRRVHLAVFGVWWVLLGISYLFTLIAKRATSPDGSRAPDRASSPPLASADRRAY